MTTKRPFARIFESPKHGQILLTATADDQGDPAISCTVDSHPEHLNPTQVTLTFKGDVCAYEKLQSYDLAMAEAFAQSIADQIDAWQLAGAST